MHVTWNYPELDETDHFYLSQFDGDFLGVSVKRNKEHTLRGLIPESQHAY